MGGEGGRVVYGDDDGGLSRRRLSLLLHIMRVHVRM